VSLPVPPRSAQSLPGSLNQPGLTALPPGTRAKLQRPKGQAAEPRERALFRPLQKASRGERCWRCGTRTVKLGDEVGVFEGVSVQRLAFDGASHRHLPSQAHACQSRACSPENA